MLRTEVSHGTALGKEVDNLISQGNFVPDELIMRIIGRWVEQQHGAFILDGVPRNIAQGEQLQQLLDGMEQPLLAAVYLQVPDKVVIERILSRIYCPGCERTSRLSNPRESILPLCANCGRAMTRRADDDPDTIRKRLGTFHEVTESLIPFYEGRGLLHRIDADTAIDEVHQRIIRSLR